MFKYIYMCDCKSKNWKSINHNRSIVYRPYYYTYYDYPYFESKYVSNYDNKYKPDSHLINKIKLADGTIIEGFGYNKNFMCLIVISIILILLFSKK